MKSDKKNIYYHKRVMDVLDPDYQKWFEQEAEYLRKTVTKNSKVLEVGCGEGRSLRDLLPITKNLTGIDYDQKAVDEAKESLKSPTIKLLKAEATKLPFKEQEFDFVICMTTFANFGSLKHKALSEMSRVLKKEGKIIISVFNEDAWPARSRVYKKAGVKVESVTNGKAILHTGIPSEQFSKTELEVIFKKSKLKIDEIIKLKISYLCKLSK